MEQNSVKLRKLAGGELMGRRVLDIVRDDFAPGAGRVTVFFARGEVLDPDGGHGQSRAALVAGIDGAPFLRFDSDTAAELPADITPSPAEHDLLADRNVIVATRNGEPAQTVMDWLRYHHRDFGLGGVIVFDRGTAAPAARFWNGIGRELDAAGLDLQVIVLTSPQPLGHPGMPAEAHPFCVTEAPGRDRMRVPKPDPQKSPLIETSIYEMARQRFLKRARAVANLDLHDLMMPAPGRPTPFDLAAEPGHSAVQLIGQHCYPWRVRKGDTVSYADHICVQFDRPRFRRRWCVAPANLPQIAILKFVRVAGMEPTESLPFSRCMAIRHPTDQPGKIVPKSSLVEAPSLVARATEKFNADPIRPPQEALTRTGPRGDHTLIVTTMKNEGPFILEWLAYHRAIGVDTFLIYTNDCTDGTDTFLKLLDRKGLVQHRDNPYRQTDRKPQHAALQAAEEERHLQEADWVICMDVDEFLNVKVGDGTLPELYAAVDGANMISCTWRLFGTSGHRTFEDRFTIEAFEKCAEEYAPKPHQAWGFKTLFRNDGIFRKLGVHRPKGLIPQLWKEINWVNGSGQRMPRSDYRNAWRSTSKTYGYDLVSLNHYAVRNAESFLVKRDRGRVNHVDRDQGLTYWFRMNNNGTTDRSIQRHLPKLRAEFDRLMADPEIAAQHHACVAAHRAKIDALKSTDKYARFYKELISDRMERLSHMHHHFGSTVFFNGPDTVPDSIVFNDHPRDFFFSLDQAAEPPRSR